MDTPTLTLKPANIDWALVQELYAQGLTAEEISERTGALVGSIRSRASRENWRELIVSAKAAAIQDLSHRWQYDMIQWLTERAKTLRAMVATSPTDAQRLESTVATHVQTGRLLFGLDQQDQMKREAGFNRATVIDLPVHVAKQLPD